MRHCVVLLVECTASRNPTVRHEFKIKMKKLLLICLIATLRLGLHAQGTITGHVTSQSKDPVPLAAISIYQKSAIVTGTASNEEGRFTVTNLNNGVYRLTVSADGFSSYEREFVLGNVVKTLDLGQITLQGAPLVMRAFTVEGTKSTVAPELDRKSFSTSDMITGANGSVLDALKHLPGVTVDQESKVQIRGSDKVTVLIDGQQSAMTGFGSQKGLENIPASQIERIEIINNPSAKYDAAGMAGIVNIVFKKQHRSGLNGDVGFTVGLGNITRRRADLPTGLPSYARNEKYSPSVNLGFRTKRFNLFFHAYWMRQDKLPNNEFSTRYYPNGDIVESQVAENRSQDIYNVKAGFDWYITENQTLTFFGLYDYEWHEDISKVWYFPNGNYNAPTRKYSFFEEEGTGLTNGTLQHKLRFVQPGHELKSQYHFTKGWEDETYNLTQEATGGYPAITGDRTHVLAPEYVHQFTSDYIKPLSFGRLEAGVQARFRNMPITYTTTRAPGNTSLIFDYGDWSEWSEDLTAGYVNLISEFKQWEVETGIRGEYTKVDYRFAPNQYFKDDKYDYFKPFPNLRATFKGIQNHEFSLFYNRRIDRPGEDILRIFPKVDDPELLKIGNPKLRPQLTDSGELAHRLSWKGGSLVTALYYKNIENYFTRIYIQDPTHANITVKGYSNIPKATNAGVELSLDQSIAKLWKLNMNGNVYRNRISGYTGVIDFPTPVAYVIRDQNDTPWFGKVNNLFTISSRVKVELSGAYFSDKVIAQGEEFSRWNINLGVKTLWLKDKLEVNLSANDIFNRMGIRQRIDQGRGYYADYQNFFETQVVTVGTKYKF